MAVESADPALTSIGEFRLDGVLARGTGWTDYRGRGPDGSQVHLCLSPTAFPSERDGTRHPAHPGILLPRSRGCIGGVHYFAFPVLDAVPLARIGHLPRGAGADLIAQVCVAMAAAHAAGVAHGALTADRILVSSAGRALVVGCGLGAGSISDDLAAILRLISEFASSADRSTSPRGGPLSAASLAEQFAAVAAQPTREASLAWCAESVLAADRIAAPRRGITQVGDALVGRAAELLSVRTALARGERFVVLTGAAGVGKSRIAHHVAAEVTNDRADPTWPGGAWACDLHACRGRAAVVRAIAAALTIPRSDGGDETGLAAGLASRPRTLLVVDDADGVVDELASLIDTFLTIAPAVSFLVTSRVRVPSANAFQLVVEPLSTGAAVDLFIARAAPSVALSDRAGIEAIVRELDGLPIVVELVAARVLALPPASAVKRMAVGYRRMADAGGVLSGAIAQSWDALSTDVQQCLATLTLFCAPFTEAAAVAVVGASAAQHLRVLVDCSLLRRLGRADSARFALLNTVRFWLLQETVADPEGERRHGAYFSRWGDWQALATLDVSGVERRNLEIEADDVSAAVEAALLRGDAHTAGRGCLALLTLAEASGSVSGTLDRALRAHTALSVPSALRSRLAGRIAELHRVAGRLGDARAWAERACGDAVSAQEPHLEAVALRGLGIILLDGGETEAAEVAYARALPVLYAAGDHRHEALLWSDRARIRRASGDLLEASHYFESALAAAQRSGDRRIEAIVLGNLAGLSLATGRLDECVRLHEMALAIHRAHGNRRFEGVSLTNLAAAHLSAGNLAESERIGRAALVVHRECGARPFEGISLGNLALCAEGMEDFAAGVELSIAALAVHRETGNRKFEAYTLGNLASMQLSLGELAAARPTLERAVGMVRALGDHAALGAFLGIRGSLCAAEGEIAEARAAFDGGETLLRAGQVTLELAQLLVRRAQFAYDGGNAEEAMSALEESERLADACGVRPSSVVRRAQARLRKQVGAAL